MTRIKRRQFLGSMIKPVASACVLGALDPIGMRWAVAAANAVYRDIGRLILERGPRAWDTRTSTSKARKISLVLGAGPKSWTARLWGKGPGDEPRDRLWTRPRDPSRHS